jgi:hypothetical protein
MSWKPFDPTLKSMVEVGPMIRVWQIPPAQLLAGGLGTVPLAPVSAVTERELPGII